MVGQRWAKLLPEEKQRYAERAGSARRRQNGLVGGADDLCSLPEEESLMEGTPQLAVRKDGPRQNGAADRPLAAVLRELTTGDHSLTVTSAIVHKLVLSYSADG